MALALRIGPLIARALTYNSQVRGADTAIGGSEAVMAEKQDQADTGERPVSLRPQDFI